MLDPQQLREALDRWDGFSPNDSTEADEFLFADAARFALTVLEQGEEMEWCEVHESKLADQGLCQWVAWGKSIEAIKPYDPESCRMVSSLRIPKAVWDPVKNEEGYDSELRKLRDAPLEPGPRDGGFRVCDCPVERADQGGEDVKADRG